MKQNSDKTEEGYQADLATDTQRVDPNSQFARAALQQSLRVADKMHPMTSFDKSPEETEKLILSPAPDALRIDEQKRHHWSDGQSFSKFGAASPMAFRQSTTSEDSQTTIS